MCLRVFLIIEIENETKMFDATQLNLRDTVFSNATPTNPRLFTRIDLSRRADSPLFQLNHQFRNTLYDE